MMKLKCIVQLGGLLSSQSMCCVDQSKEVYSASFNCDKKININLHLQLLLQLMRIMILLAENSNHLNLNISFLSSTWRI